MQHIILSDMRIDVKKLSPFKTRCKGDESNIENSTDHFCEDTKQNASIFVCSSFLAH